MRECSWASAGSAVADDEGVEGGAEGARESIASRRELSSSRATSHLPVRMSHASLPQWAEMVRSGSVERTRKW